MRRILILSDHPLFGHCVESLLQGRAGIEIVGRETSAEAAIGRIKELPPDVVIVDSGLSERDATAVLRVLEAGPGCRVVALSRRDNTISVYRGEQRTVSDTGDLLAAIGADPLAAGQAASPPVAPTPGMEGGRKAELRSRTGGLEVVDSATHSSKEESCHG